MKRLLFSLVLFLGLFIIGCQENPITDPVSIEQVNKVQSSEEDIIQGTIPLDGMLVLHGGFQTYFSIVGQINFTHELVLLDPAPPAQQSYVILNLSVRATLSDDGHNRFNISSTSQDYVFVQEDGSAMLEKSYPLLGREDGLALRCRFLVLTDGVSLDSKWLALPDDGSINKVGLPGDIVTYPPVRIDVVQ